MRRTTMHPAAERTVIGPGSAASATAGVVAALSLVAVPAAADESPADAFSIGWATVDGGGGASAGGDFSVQGTVGQPDAGDAAGGPWTLAGGYWTAAGDGTPPPPCPGDVDDNGAVEFDDLLAVLSAFGLCDGCPEDLDGSGAVDFDDLLTVVGGFGPCP